MNWLLAILVAAAGLGQPAQSAMNARLRESAHAPMASAFVSLAMSTLLLLPLAALGVMGKPQLSEMAKAPWWAWGGGVIGAASVTTNLIAQPKISAGVTIAAAVFGQLLAAVVIDHFGWLGTPRVPLNPWRVAGVVALFAGVLMIQKR